MHAHIFKTALLLLAMLIGGCNMGSQTTAPPPEASSIKVYSVEKGGYVTTDQVVRSESEWKNVLSGEEFHILREKGTERAGTGKYADHQEEGTYTCAGCGLDLFSSEDKFESGTGWPSFTRPVAGENIITRPDNFLFLRRTEVVCRRCGGHLGHVFEDGPPPTGLRYCINSAALDFVGKKSRSSK